MFLVSIFGANLDAQFTLDLAFSTAVAQLPVSQKPMDDFEYLDECAVKWQDLPTKKLTRQQQAVVDVVSAIGLIEGDGVEALWSECDGYTDRIIESFRMAGASDIADRLQGTSFCKDIIARTRPGADDWAYSSPEEKKKLRDVLFFVSKKGPDAREGLLQFLPKRRS